MVARAFLDKSMHNNLIGASEGAPIGERASTDEIVIHDSTISDAAMHETSGPVLV